MEDDLGISITDHFDLIAGTSTGGIIALALGLGLSPKQIVDFYLEQGSSIFPRWPVEVNGGKKQVIGIKWIIR